MSENKEIPLAVLNICSRGKSLSEAWEIYGKGQNSQPVKQDEQEPKKLSASEKKELLAKQIEELGGNVPSAGSVAIFEQALTLAKEAKQAEESKNEEGDE